jgi:hypothetical protein
MLNAACTDIQSLVNRLKMRYFKVEDIKKSSVLSRRNSNSESSGTCLGIWWPKFKSV